jgi:hypothetical protein
MRNKEHQFNGLPSLSIAQGEIAGYSRTGSPLHLAHAARALENACESLRQCARRNWGTDGDDGAEGHSHGGR